MFGTLRLVGIYGNQQAEMKAGEKNESERAAEDGRGAWHQD
jgi:hypothetical protein